MPKNRTTKDRQSKGRNCSALPPSAGLSLDSRDRKARPKAASGNAKETTSQVAAPRAHAGLAKSIDDGLWLTWSAPVDIPEECLRYLKWLKANQPALLRNGQGQSAFRNALTGDHLGSAWPFVVSVNLPGENESRQIRLDVSEQDRRLLIGNRERLLKSYVSCLNHMKKLQASQKLRLDSIETVSALIHAAFKPEEKPGNHGKDLDPVDIPQLRQILEAEGRLLKAVDKVSVGGSLKSHVCGLRCLIQFVARIHAQIEVRADEFGYSLVEATGSATINDAMRGIRPEVFMVALESIRALKQQEVLLAAKVEQHLLTSLMGGAPILTDDDPKYSIQIIKHKRNQSFSLSVDGRKSIKVSNRILMLLLAMYLRWRNTEGVFEKSEIAVLTERGTREANLVHALRQRLRSAGISDAKEIVRQIRGAETYYLRNVRMWCDSKVLAAMQRSSDRMLSSMAENLGEHLRSRPL